MCCTDAPASQFLETGHDVVRHRDDIPVHPSVLADHFGRKATKLLQREGSAVKGGKDAAAGSGSAVEGQEMVVIGHVVSVWVKIRKIIA